MSAIATAECTIRGLASPTFLRRRLTDLRGSGCNGVRLLDEPLVDAGSHSRSSGRSWHWCDAPVSLDRSASGSTGEMASRWPLTDPPGVHVRAHDRRVHDSRT